MGVSLKGKIKRWWMNHSRLMRVPGSKQFRQTAWFNGILFGALWVLKDEYDNERGVFKKKTPNEFPEDEIKRWNQGLSGGKLLEPPKQEKPVDPMWVPPKDYKPQPKAA
eukprot:GDKI01000635.1.p2 GENE.GDKI01000635.1~~GDKI01000635.1.p2  ORF type:complete len:109 (-),score=30.48 GDKI01000635.1:287-613(-)